MKSLTVQSPSKINLYLKVTGRRKDGYHKLVTVFQRISLSDTIYLKKQNADFNLTCRIASGLKQTLSCGEDNLITKAHRLLQEKFPKIGGVSVRLIKKTPMGAGIGGGSGNAAAFLSAMNKLYSLKISKKNLAKLGSQLGADVAFFLYDVPLAVGRGVGDKITVQKSSEKNWFVLIISEEGLSTPLVYKALPAKLPAFSVKKSEKAVKEITRLAERGRLSDSKALLENDLEAPAFSLRPQLEKMFKKISEKAEFPARMTGSGPTLFAALPDQVTARKLARLLRVEFPGNKILVCSSL